MTRKQLDSQGDKGSWSATAARWAASESESVQVFIETIKNDFNFALLCNLN